MVKKKVSEQSELIKINIIIAIFNKKITIKYCPHIVQVQLNVSHNDIFHNHS